MGSDERDAVLAFLEQSTQYAPQSGEILGILKQLKEGMEKDVEDQGAPYKRNQNGEIRPKCILRSQMFANFRVALELTSSGSCRSSNQRNSRNPHIFAGDRRNLQIFAQKKLVSPICQGPV